MRGAIHRDWRAMRVGLALVLLICATQAAIAQGWAGRTDTGRMAALAQVLRISDTVALMREEGLAYGDQVAASLLPDADPSGWRAQVSRIYDTARMERSVVQELERRLVGVDLAPMLRFYRSKAGVRAVEMELAARRAFLDPEVEAAAREAAAEAEGATAGPQMRLLAQIARLVSSGDLVERNVTALLNADMMFWRGVMDAGGPGPAGGDADLADIVTADLAAMRRDTEVWMTAFLLVACGPLSETQMEAYASFSETRDGRVLNAALFAGFDGMYDQLAYLLGHAAGTWVTSTPL